MRGRNRETEKQRNRETEKQRNRETEKQRNRETEKQRNKVFGMEACSNTRYNVFCAVVLKFALTNGGIKKPHSLFRK
jgi:hypothetical protein